LSIQGVMIGKKSIPVCNNRCCSPAAAPTEAIVGACKIFSRCPSYTLSVCGDAQNVALLARNERNVTAAAVEIAAQSGVRALGLAADVPDTRSLQTALAAADLAARRITVNAIIPGLVGSEFRQSSARQLAERAGQSAEEAITAVCADKGILLGRSAEMSDPR
jgi:short-subunit dehydrogenase